MLLPVTTLYAAIPTLILVALAINVTLHRRKLKVGLGTGNNPIMLRMMRIHGNAVEYIPIAVLLMLIYELNGGAHTTLHLCGCALILGRVLHAAGLWNSDGQSVGRAIGQSLTWLTILILAVVNLLKVL
jgi:uncharacterized protein